MIRHPEMGRRWWSRRQHPDRVKGYVDLGIKEGAAQLVVDGCGHPGRGHPNGFLPGGLSVRPRHRASMRIYREEIFGPVLVVVRVLD